ncbi:hypothetical protein [Edaphocola flava]|uniref:hypothetical protein n=1 Tax=Edaphocola flava TaxID=2499629 RepID=UPI00100A911A|nr:hypothetical protein [Edaphocola flava]
MTTLRGFVRSMNAAANRAEREHQRRNREAAKKFKEQQKQFELKNATESVDTWNEYVTVLKTLHWDCSEKIDWFQINNVIKPIMPQNEHYHEKTAQHKLSNFKPSTFHKMLGMTKRKIRKLEENVKEAISKDQLHFQNLIQQYNEDVTEWEMLNKMAQGIINKKPEVYLEVIKYFEPFADINDLGTNISFYFNPNFINIDLDTNGAQIIPDYELKLTTTGKLSRKIMSKSNFYELYQDHICSAVLRIARETFAHIPVEYVVINAHAEMLNSESGHIEKQIILSIKAYPETLEKLNMKQLDPSNSMNNFIHNMNFKKTSGFLPVGQIQ